MSFLPLTGPVGMAADFLMNWFVKPLIILVKLYFKHWQITFPITAILLAFWYHNHTVSDLNAKLAKMHSDNTVLAGAFHSCATTRLNLAEGLKSLDTQIKELGDTQAKSLEALRAQVASADVQASSRLKRIQAEFDARQKVIPQDCAGALNWLKEQRYDWESVK